MEVFRRSQLSEIRMAIRQADEIVRRLEGVGSPQVATVRREAHKLRQILTKAQEDKRSKS